MPDESLRSTSLTVHPAGKTKDMVDRDGRARDDDGVDDDGDNDVDNGTGVIAGNGCQSRTTGGTTVVGASGNVGTNSSIAD